MRIFLPFLISLFASVNSQQFSDYRVRYDNFDQNDPRAIPYVKAYVAAAKKERNYKELFQAYKDAIHFTPNQKLIYADSAIWAASQTKDRDLTAMSYLTKGTVYYFNYRKFQPALNEYLKAWQFSQHSSDQYLYYKNLYHIGVVKSFLGHYDEALKIFQKCNLFFSKEQVSPEPPNIKYNRKKGYLNSLHQTAICLTELHQLQEAGIIAEKGIAESRAQADFYAERSYFYKVKGIIAYHQQLYKAAIQELNTSLAGIEKKNDFTNASLVYYYKGKSQERLGEKEEAVKNFKKVDSIFSIHSFILPEVRGSYEFLIKYSRDNDRKDQGFYYTDQLLKADKILEHDFKYLVKRIHKEYDTQDLIAEQKRLEYSVSNLYLFGAFSAGTLIFAIVIIYRKMRSMRPAARRSLPLKGNGDAAGRSNEAKGEGENSMKVPEAVVTAVLKKLEIMERDQFFLEKKMTLHKLAPKLDTNVNYLSKIIYESKGHHFNDYIKQLRILYVTKMLDDHRLWRNYSLETLANECGFGDRNNFSKAFSAHHSMSPIEYIQKRNAALSEGE